MRLSRSVAVLGAVLLAAWGCTREPANLAGAASRSTIHAYDPARDPAVNPPALFEPFPAGQPGAAAEDETLLRIIEGNPANLNPIFMSSTYEFYAAGLLFDNLFSFDAKMDWFVNPAMVASFEESEDRLVSTVTLKPGLAWHDGRPVTSADVRFSWEAILDDSVPCPAVKPGTDQIADVRIIDGLTFAFVHKEARPTNMWNMLFPIIPQHVYGHPEERARDATLSNSDYYNHHNRREVIGNGPYRLVEWITDDRIVFERWDGYTGPRPHFRRQILKIQPDANVTLLLFKKGEVDEMRLTEQQFATQTGDDGFRAAGVKAFAPQWAFSYIGWNMDGSNPFFTDVRVRRAMAHAMDLQRVIRDVAYNLATPCMGIYHADAWMYNPDIEPITFDLARASALLDEAGWHIDEGRGGWRFKVIEGRPVKFEFTLHIPQGSATSPRIAAIYQRDLKRIGVSLLTRIIEWATFMEMAHQHEFQAQIAAWGTGTDPDTGWNLWRSDQYDGGRNYGGYSNARVDRLFEKGRAEFDREKRAAHYREIQKIVYDEQPYLFLYNRATTWAFHKRLRGIQFSPRGVFNFHPSDKAWWVPAALRMH